MSWSRSATTPQLTECITLPLPRAAETVSVYNTLFNVGCRYIYIETSILSPDLGQCRSAHLVLVWPESVQRSCCQQREGRRDGHFCSGLNALLHVEYIIHRSVKAQLPFGVPNKILTTGSRPRPSTLSSCWTVKTTFSRIKILNSLKRALFYLSTYANFMLNMNY